MANKEATLILLDTRGEDGNTYLDNATTAIHQILNSKIIGGKKNDQVAILLVGSKDTEHPLDSDRSGYRNIKLQYGFSMADLDMLKYITQSCEKGQKAGDIMDGIVVGITVLEQHCKHLKWEKTIFVFTDAASPINPDGFTEIQDKAVDYDVKVNVIGFGFKDDPPPDDDQSTLAQNNRLLRTFASATHGEVFPGSEALALLNNLRARSVRPTTLIRERMSLVMETKLPSGKKWSKVAADAADAGEEPTLGEVKMERTYKLAQQAIEDDAETGAMRVADDVELDKDDLVKSYKYGKDLVPFAEEDMEAMKLRTTKGFSILGFVHQTDVIHTRPCQRYLQNNIEASHLPLNSGKKCALVRYVRIDNAAPKLGILVPHIGKKIWCAWIQVPYKEDIREYAFPSLTPLLEDVTPTSQIPASSQPATLLSNAATQNATLSATQRSTDNRSLPLGGNGSLLHGATLPTYQPTVDASQTLNASQSSQTLAMSIRKGPSEKIIAPAKKKALTHTRLVTSEDADRRIDEFIGSMDLMTAIEDDGEFFEAYKPTDVFNPAYQRMYQCMAFRAMNPDSNELPPMDPRFIAGILPLPDLIEKAQPHLTAVKEAFKIEKVDTGKETNRARFARQIDAADAITDQLALTDTNIDNDMSFAKLTTSLVVNIGTSDPVADFKAMLARRDVDLVASAIDQMTAIIATLVQKSFATQLYGKAGRCIEALREGCIVQSEVGRFNEWVKAYKEEVRRTFPAFWEFWREEVKVGVVSKEESGESEVTSEEAEEFFKAGESMEVEEAPVVEDVDDDEMVTR
ncbi:hypothetical protein BC829DRAFT_414707 [Chytridium lagenaria]|nr:hypothetical protein BC829DRAFT_414707 [Chytridium lagenaria]